MAEAGLPRCDNFWRVVIAAYLVAASPALGAETLHREAINRATSQIETWQSCLFDFSTRVGPDNADPASVVAEAALAICMRNESAAFDAVANYGPIELRPRWRKFVATDVWPDIRKNMEAKTVAAVLAARSRAKHQLR